MPSEQVLLDFILHAVAKEKDLSGKKVLVTAGPTRECIDPVRFISNHSTGESIFPATRIKQTTQQEKWVMPLRVRQC